MTCDPTLILFLQGEEGTVVDKMVQSPGLLGTAQLLEKGTSSTVRPLERHSGALMEMKTALDSIFDPPNRQKCRCSV